MAGLQYKFFPTDFFVPAVVVDGDHLLTSSPPLVSLRTRNPTEFTDSDSSSKTNSLIVHNEAGKDIKLVAKVARSSSSQAVAPILKQQKREEEEEGQGDSESD
ncbi:hypothetical protein Ancab_013870 [Ancistrocladus abbreviatus]